ncbi:hypothetical protein K492DRAFT_200008 [Lichtheimia hyalospora FSU 10163]|nr:hypothetical protein K492DRAFT_200008 [Lichtheimia hyalospora FSU 10163]
MTQQAGAKRETSAVHSLPVLFLQVAYTLMGIRCIEGHSHMTSNQRESSPNSRYLSDNVTFWRHIQYWDRGEKGYITPIDTTAGFMDLGYSTAFSLVLGMFLSVIIAYATQESWVPDPLCRIQVSNLTKLSKNHRGKQTIYNDHGETDCEKFKRLYTKYAQWDPTGERMTISEAIHMASEEGSFGVSPLLWAQGILPWIMIYCIVGKNGTFAKNNIQDFYNGTLFFHLRDDSQSSRLVDNRAKRIARQPSASDNESTRHGKAFIAIPTLSEKESQKPSVPIIQLPETYGKYGDSLSAVQSSTMGDLHTKYYDNDEITKEDGIEFITGYNCFVHYPTFDKFSDKGGIYNDDRLTFTGLVKASNNGAGSNGSDVSLSGLSHDMEYEHSTMHTMLVQDPKYIRPRQHAELDPIVLHGVRTWNNDNDNDLHFVQSPGGMACKDATTTHMHQGSLAGIQSKQNDRLMVEEEICMAPQSHKILRNDDEDIFDTPFSIGLRKSDSGYAGLVEEPDYARHKYPRKLSLSGLQLNTNDQGSVDVDFNATQSRVPIVYSEELMLSDELKAQADLQEHMLKSWLNTEYPAGVSSDSISRYQDASESIPDGHCQHVGNYNNQVMHGLVSYEKPNVCRNRLNIDLLAGVKPELKLYEDAVPDLEHEYMESKDLEYFRQDFPLAGVSNQNIPIKSWVNADNLPGVQRDKTIVYENASDEMPIDYIDPFKSDMQHELELLSGIRTDVNDMTPTKNGIDAAILTGIDPLSFSSLHENVGDSIPSGDMQAVPKEETRAFNRSLSNTIEDSSFMVASSKDMLKSSTLSTMQTSPELTKTSKPLMHDDYIEPTLQNKMDNIATPEPKNSEQHATTMDTTLDLPELTDPGNSPCEEKDKALPPLPTSTAQSSDEDDQSVVSFGSIQPPAVFGLPKKQSPHRNMIVERENWPIMADVADCKE